jgi:hypothetical protein
MGENTREPWLRIEEPPSGFLSDKMEAAIRSYAKAITGKDDLRGFNKTLEKWGWDYYDVLAEVSP